MTPPAATRDDVDEIRRRAEQDETVLVQAVEHHAQRLLALLGALAAARRRLGTDAIPWAPPRTLQQRLAAFGGSLT